MPDEDAFLNRVGHDLRGELATVVAGVHYLMRYETGLGEPGKQMLERVNGAGNRLRRLLDELELATWIEGRLPLPAGGPSPERGAAQLVTEPCRLSMLVEAALGRIERSVAQRRVTVHADLPADVPADLAEIDGDPELLGAAVEYLLDFAVARSPGRSVEVRAVGPATLSIADEGGPVAAAVLARLFEPFAEKELIPRPEPGARRRDRLGLGLAIARGIFGAHGGSLTASASDRGLTLTATLRRDGAPSCHAPRPV
jgi:two-component system, OmpR family, sensor kinase